MQKKSLLAFLFLIDGTHGIYKDSVHFTKDQSVLISLAKKQQHHEIFFIIGNFFGMNKKKRNFSFKSSDSYSEKFVYWKFDFQVFDKNWHKVHVGVFRDGVMLYVDCKEQAYGGLPSRKEVQTDGLLTLAKYLFERTTAPVRNSFLYNISHSLSLW